MSVDNSVNQIVDAETGVRASGGVGNTAAFSPDSVAGLQVWFKADSGTSTTTDGVAISQWNDSSGNTRHATQATGSLQPIYKAAIQNGLPVVRFDGADDQLKTGIFTLNQPTTWFIVGAYRGVFNAAKNVFTDGLSAAFCNVISRDGATLQGCFAGITALDVTTTPQAFHVYTVLFNGASSEIRVDGGIAITGNAGTNNAGGVSLGASATGTQTGDADLAEVLAYSITPSTINRQNIEANLKSRWGTP